MKIKPIIASLLLLADAAGAERQPRAARIQLRTIERGKT